jgi:hypothetical protein
MGIVKRDEDGNARIIGMDPVAAAALVVLVIMMLIALATSDDKPVDPMEDPFPTVSTK